MKDRYNIVILIGFYLIGIHYILTSNRLPIKSEAIDMINSTFSFLGISNEINDLIYSSLISLFLFLSITGISYAILRK